MDMTDRQRDMQMDEHEERSHWKSELAREAYYRSSYLAQSPVYTPQKSKLFII
jgi:hypothetical protein